VNKVGEVEGESEGKSLGADVESQSRLKIDTIERMQGDEAPIVIGCYGFTNTLQLEGEEGIGVDRWLSSPLNTLLLFTQASWISCSTGID